MNPTGIEARSCPSCNGTGDLGGNPSYGMCPDCDGTGKFPPDAATLPADVAGIVERLEVARDFPKNTCPASRHVQMIGEALIARQPYAMIEEDPEYVGQSILSVVASLYETRTELSEAATLISSLTVERDNLEAWFDGLTPSEMSAWHDRTIKRAEASEAALATAREALERAVAILDGELGSGWGDRNQADWMMIDAARKDSTP